MPHNVMCVHHTDKHDNVRNQWPNATGTYAILRGAVRCRIHSGSAEYAFTICTCGNEIACKRTENSTQTHLGVRRWCGCRLWMFPAHTPTCTSNLYFEICCYDHANRLRSRRRKSHEHCELRGAPSTSSLPVRLRTLSLVLFVVLLLHNTCKQWFRTIPETLRDTKWQWFLLFATHCGDRRHCQRCRIGHDFWTRYMKTSVGVAHPGATTAKTPPRVHTCPQDVVHFVHSFQCAKDATNIKIPLFFGLSAEGNVCNGIYKSSFLSQGTRIA